MKKGFGLFQQKRKRGRKGNSRNIRDEKYARSYRNRSDEDDDDDRYDREDPQYDEDEDDRYDRDDQQYDDDYEEDDSYEDDDRYDQDDLKNDENGHYDDDQDDYKDDQDDYDDRDDVRDEDDRYDQDRTYAQDETYDDDDAYNDEDRDENRQKDSRRYRRNDRDEYEEEYEDYEDDDDDYDDGYEDDYDDDDDDEDGRRRRRHAENVRGRKRPHRKVVSFLKHSNAMERVALMAGGLIIAVGISVGTLFAQAQARNKEVASFKDVGTQLDGVKVIGESGLLAVADAQQAKLAASDAASAASSAASDENESVQVKMTLATIKKDIKIKFLNKETGKLIASVPFTVKVEGPSGSKTYEDDDMDGIIYKSDIAAGTYKVTMQPLDDKYSKYSISEDTQKITVKDTIVYKKVDVKDEIKTEAQVNVAKEDTQVQNTPVESANKDTVDWVESTKTEIGTDDSTTAYSAIDKSTIADPTASARLKGKGVSRLDGIELGIKGDTAMKVGDTQTLSVSGLPDGGKVSSWKSDSSAASVDDSGKVTAASAGTAKITASCAYNETSNVSTTYATTAKDASGNISATTATTTESKTTGKTQDVIITINVSEKATATYSLTPSTASVTTGGTVQLTASSTNLSDTKVTWSSSDTSIATVSDAGLVTAGKTGGKTAVITAKFSDGHTETAKITVSETTYTIKSVSADKTSIAVGGTATLSAVTDPTGGTVTWTSDKTSVATVKDSTVTGVAAGTATLTATVGSSTKTLTITVTSDKAAVTLSATKLTLLVGKTSTLTATVTDLTAKTVTWASSDSSVATVSSSGKVTAVKAGTATITATSTADTSKTATCAVTVMDSTSVLKDKSGNVVYILKDGKYVQATYADYYTASKFYIQTAGKKYKYTGWQTIDGKTYFYDKDGNVVTGEQTIQGAKYTFGSDGALQTGSGNMGIDVSKWNGNIDWAAVKNSGVSFVIIRCGYRGSSTGALIEDPKFRSNINGATAAGLKVGVYFFTQAISDVEAVEEASMVADLCSGHSLSYPVYLDVEGSNGRGDSIDAATRTTVCKAFCATMANAGYGTGIYANRTWLTSRINTSSLTGYKIWLAQYAAKPTYSATRYDMWQYTSKGSVTGISGRVDLDICY